MTSFVIGVTTSAVQTLTDVEAGFVTALGNIVNLSTGAHTVSMSGHSMLTVLGAVSNTVNGPFNAVHGDGIAMNLVVGGQGYAGGFTDAVNMTATERASITNAGIIESVGGRAITLTASDAGFEANIINSGSITAQRGQAIDVRTGVDGVFTLQNSGLVSGLGEAVIVVSGKLIAYNSGTITAFGDPDSAAQNAIDIVAVANDVINNSGTIFGAVLLGAGNDQFLGDEGHIHGALMGEDGNDRLITGQGDDEIYGGSGNDFLAAGDGLNAVSGDDGDDQLFGGAEDDRLFGGKGDDVMVGRAGSDSFDGGQGTDLVDLHLSGAAVWADLIVGEGAGGDAEGDSYIGIENLRGTAFADGLYGSNAAGDVGGNNALRGGRGADTLDGRGGNDVLRGDGGADVLIGGDGQDTASYAGSNDGVTVNLATGKASGGDAQGDKLSQIESLNGSVFADVLTGNAGANRLSGAAGNDTLSGGAGADLLTGGAGADSFVFSAGFGADRILDFDDSADRLNLHSYGFATTGEALSHATEVGGDVLFDFGGGDTLLLDGQAAHGIAVLAATLIL